ncbi:hypothetical protein PQX77_013942 [Marasmius sp. AFHP31]|nr:hypothetical protein PQX77_013942 [Marasmius sp. AFHP31]
MNIPQLSVTSGAQTDTISAPVNGQISQKMQLECDTKKIKPNVVETDAAPPPPTCEALCGVQCTLPVDIAIQSSDGESIGAHTRHLSVLTQGFPGIEAASFTRRKSLRLVSLPENSATLRIFLSFTHNTGARDLSVISTDGLISLAEAAERYGNGYALTACRNMFPIAPKRSLQDALKILMLKIRISDTEDIDSVAR